MRSRAYSSCTTRRLSAARRLALCGASLLLVPGCAAVLGFEDTTRRADGAGEGGTVDGGPDRDGFATPDGAASRLTTTPASLLLRRGGSADVTVDVTRGSDVTGTVTARLTNLPPGVTATTATLDPAATSGKVTLTATSKATLGSSTVGVVADGTSLAPASLPLLVSDAPGTLDTTFDSDGFVSDLSKGLGATFFAVASQSDGKILAGGAGFPAGGPLNGWIVRRYDANGVPDTGFNAASAGLPADGELHAMVIDGAGKIICVGSSTQVPGSLLLTVVRLLPTGAVDGTFGGGAVRLPLAEGPMGSIGLGVAVQADGAVVVVGSRRDELKGDAGVIARFTTNGARDMAFNGGATIAIDRASRLIGVSVDAAGNVVAAGSSTSAALPSYVLAKRTAQGAADPAFGTGGVATFGNTYNANAFTRLVDGTMVVVGDVAGGAYTAGATTDKGTALFARAYAIAPGAGFFGIAAQDQKRFIAAGHTAVLNGEARIERLFADGSPDNSFGTAGVSTIEASGPANTFDVTLFAAAVQADGRILAAGNRSNAGAVIYRVWP